jgi:lipid-binding SYLF domain-containing protein
MNMTKLLLSGLLLLALAVPAWADEDKSQLDARVRKLAEKFEAMQANPEKAVPAAELSKARAVVLLDRTKAGFIFAYQGGSGVALAKKGSTEDYGPAAFLKANEASLGFQIGGEQAFYVILLMSTNAARHLADSKIDFAGEARGTAGDQSAGEEGRFSADEHPIRVYSDRAGLYGGAALKGGAIAADDKANRTYYGEYFTIQDILFDGKVKPTDAARDLAKKLTAAATDKKK